MFFFLLQFYWAIFTKMVEKLKNKQENLQNLLKNFAGAFGAGKNFPSGGRLENPGRALRGAPRDNRGGARVCAPRAPPENEGGVGYPDL